MKLLFALILMASSLLYSSEVNATELSANELRAADTIQNICASSQSILVVDDFSLEPSKSYDDNETESPYMDFNGDGRPDGSHGDLVVAICRLSGKTCNTYNLPQQIPGRLLVETFTKLVDRIESGSIEKPIAINLSAKLKLRITNVNKLGLPVTLSPENLLPQKNNILEALLNSSENKDIYPPMYALFQRLHHLGITVITTSGNEGNPDIFNFYTLLPGVITVGALDSQYQIAEYSNVNSLTDLYRVGDFYGRLVAGGIDINGDEQPEFFKAKLSGKKPLVSLYNGKSPSEVVSPLSERLLSMRGDENLLQMAIGRRMLKDGLYRDSDFLPEGSPSGDSFTLIPTLLKLELIDGKIYYNPKKDLDPHIVTEWRGTSFAAPNICNP